MTEKIIASRFIQKHDMEAAWNNSSYIPRKAELIIYDDNRTVNRIKIGDGVKTVKELSFIGGSASGDPSDGLTYASTTEIDALFA